MDNFEEFIVKKYPNRSLKVLLHKLQENDGTWFYAVKEVQDQSDAWQSQQAEIDEKDKRIEELEKACISYKNQRDDNAKKLMVKSVHYNSIQEDLAKLKDRLELAHHLAIQSTWSSLKQLKKVVKALRGESE